MNNNNTIKFYLGDENRLVIENSSNDSIFQEQYSNLFGNLKQIMPDIYTEKDVPPQDGVAVEKTVNNVFAFIGERGSGKSSCMISAAEMLKKGEDEVVKTIHKSDKDSGTLTFEVLETIDPSFFDEKVNILEIILGKMFSKFLKEVEKESCRSLDDFANKKNKLFESFQEVKNCLCQLNHQDISEDDSVERLVDLAASVKMQSAFQLLVNRYLDLVKKDVLVIPIDDIDLHVTGAYKMVEQIRKYLIQKNVIVMMALKLEQLEKVLENEYLQQYKSVIEKGMLSTDRITEMAAKYLIKFIPQSHRIFMPDMNLFMDTIVEYYKPDGADGNGHNGRKWLKEDSFPTYSLKYAVTALIFRKTRFLFYHSKGRTSLIVPKNLRSLRHLIGLLYGMDDSNRTSNKDQFKKYFFETWINNNLDLSGTALFQKLMAEPNASQFNKLVVKLLKNKYKENELKDFLSPKETVKTLLNKGVATEYLDLLYILQDANASYNVSLGDVVVLLSFLKERLVSFEDLVLIFAIETLYSMKLYEYYDYITEEVQIVAKNQNISETIRRNSLLDNISEYEKIVGGSFINIKSNRFLASEGPANVDWRKDVYYRDLRRGDVGSIKKLGNLKQKELAALLVSRKRYNTKNTSDMTFDATYRQQKEVVYALYDIEDEVKSFTGNQNIYIDLSSLFFNLINIKRTYGKIDPTLYEIANKNRESILNKLRIATIKKDSEEVNGKINTDNTKIVNDEIDKRQRDSEELTIQGNCIYIDSELADKNKIKKGWYNIDDIHRRFLSWCSIRNMEILEALIEHIVVRRDAPKSFDDFFNIVSKFSIKTYPLNSSVIPYDIKFDFVDVLKKEPFFKGDDNDFEKNFPVEMHGDKKKSSSNKNDLFPINVEEMINQTKANAANGDYRCSDIMKVFNKLYPTIVSSNAEILQTIFVSGNTYSKIEFRARLSGINKVLNDK